MVQALPSQRAGIARLCAWIEAHRDPALDYWDQFDDCLRQRAQDLPPQPQPKRRHRQRTPRPPDGLLTAAQAAAKLGCSIKTLKGHVAAGAVKYVIIGHGAKRPRRMFTDVDLDEFIANQTRKDVSCPSTRTRARHTGNSTFSGEVIAFTALPRPAPGVKPKK
jgi:hypothetical protein